MMQFFLNHPILEDSANKISRRSVHKCIGGPVQPKYAVNLCLLTYGDTKNSSEYNLNMI